MDWTTIIVAILSSLLTGSSVIFYKENKKKAKAEAKKEDASANVEDASAANTLLNVLNGFKAYMESITSYNQNINLKLLEDIRNKDKDIEEFKKEISSLKQKVAENERKLSGLQKAFETEVSARQEAEKYKCVVENCKLRQPPLKKQIA